MGEILAKKVKLKNGDSVILRTPKKGDGSALISFTKQVLQNAPWAIMKPEEFFATTEGKERWINDHLNHPESLIIVAEKNGQAIGLLDFSNQIFKRTSHVGGFGMSLLPEWRGLGLGKEMLLQLLDWVKDNTSIEKINLEVLSNNESAIGLYCSLGFVKEGRKSKEIKVSETEYLDLILMAKCI